MDAVIQGATREPYAQAHGQEYVQRCMRKTWKLNEEYPDLTFAFDSGGMIREAMNEGKSTRFNVRIVAKNYGKGADLAAAINQA